MSGIGDGDNSDLQRIREVNQAELQRRTDQQKRSHQARVERSFKEVMADRGREKVAQQAQQQHATTQSAANPRDAAGKRLLAQVRAQGQQSHVSLAKKAALSQSMAGTMAKGRTKGHRADAIAAESRGEESLARATDELDHVQDKAREDDLREVRTTDEKQAEIIHEGRGDGPIQRDGGERRREQRDRSGSEDGPKAEGVNSSEGAAPSRRVHVPPALIQQLVSAVFKAVGPDGRTQMQIHLRGGPLDGVKLEVRAENGQVECTFHGCDREMEGLLKEGRKALASGLSKRGLKLTGLTVK